ncbi:DUF927 domain-containing protein [Sphingobium sp. AN641]|uniref:DUF927 domain-containing protein n=1 Tax=Sphingobium sp. AN641 TaxID=3133443 RepID=UPI0030C51A35
MKKFFDIRARGVRAASGALLYEIREYDKIGYIDAQEFARRPNDAIANLAACELTFVGKRKTRLIEVLSEIEDFEPEAIFDRFGWNGSYFVYLDGRVFAPEGFSSAEVVCELKPDRVHQTGTLDSWLASVASPLAGHQVCEFFLMAAFAAPLRSLLNREENCGFEAAGEAAAGKSTLLNLVSSACGGFLGGEQGKYGLSFATTAAGIEWETQNYSDLPLIVDDGTLFELGASPRARANSLMQLLMALGKGEEKRRYGATSRKFKFVFLTNANQSLLQIISGQNAAEVIEAVSHRLSTIPLLGREFGVFDHLPPGYVDIDDFIADLINAASENHGWAMPHYLRQLVQKVHDDPEGFRARLEGHIAAFRKHACVEANGGSARRVVDAFGLICAAGHLAKHFGALPDSFSPLASTLGCYRLNRASRAPLPSPAEMLKALADDPDIVDLDVVGKRRMSDKQLAAVKCFRQTTRQGEVEHLLNPAYIRSLIPGWNRARRDDYEVVRMIRRDGDHHTVKRSVRSNKANDRFICMILDRKKAKK